jgi:hypothetical protein
MDQTAVRGASAIVDNSRMTALLVGMSANDAKKYGIEDRDRNQYCRLEIVKNNYGKSGTICWVQRVIVPGYETVSLQRVPLIEQPKGMQGKNSTVGNPIAKIVELIGKEPGCYSVRRFAQKSGGEESDFGFGVNRLEELVREMVADGKLMLRAPTAAERKRYSHTSNVRHVLAVKDDVPTGLLPAAAGPAAHPASEAADNWEEDAEEPIEDVF